MSNIITNIKNSLLDTEYFYGNEQTLNDFINAYKEDKDAVYIQNQYGLKEFEGTIQEALEYLTRLEAANNVVYSQASFWHVDEENETGKFLLVSVNIT